MVAGTEWGRVRALRDFNGQTREQAGPFIIVYVVGFCNMHTCIQTHAQTHTQTHTLSLSLSLPFSFSHTHTNTHTCTCEAGPSIQEDVAGFCGTHTFIQTYTQTHRHSLSFSLSLSLTHTNKHTHAHIYTHTLTHTHTTQVRQQWLMWLVSGGIQVLVTSCISCPRYLLLYF